MPDALKIDVKAPDIAGAVARAKPAMLEAGVRALSNALIRNFSQRNARGNSRGFPRSNFWQSAAESVTSRVEGDAMVATVTQPGVRLRWLGGVVKPVRGKALAIPARPEAAGMNPREYAGKGGVVFAIWPKHRHFGILAARENGRLKPMWWLVSKTKHHPDETVIPPRGELLPKIEGAMRRALRAAL